MTDLIARLDEIRQMQGKEPLPDPTKIQETGAPPPPPYQVREREPGEVPEPTWLDENPDADEYDLLPDEPSPLIPRQKPQVGTGTNFTPPASLPQPDLAVAVYGAERVASLKGKEVTLAEGDVARIAVVIIHALRRNLREQEAELAGLLPKRVRKKKAVITAPSKAVESADRKAAGAAQPVPPPPPKRSVARNISEGIMTTQMAPPTKKRGRPKKVRQHLDGTESPQ